MPSKDFKCKQCGNCCINLGDAFSICATEEDIDLWEEEGRNDILEWVGFTGDFDDIIHGEDKGWHIFKAYFLHKTIMHPGAGNDSAGGCIDYNRCFR
jgi:hypothetical protein